MGRGVRKAGDVSRESKKAVQDARSALSTARWSLQGIVEEGEHLDLNALMAQAARCRLARQTLIEANEAHRKAERDAADAKRHAFPYQCVGCNARFKAQQGLRTHIRRRLADPQHTLMSEEAMIARGSE